MTCKHCDDEQLDTHRVLCGYAIASAIQDILDESFKDLYDIAGGGNIGWNQQMDLEAGLSEVQVKLGKVQKLVKEAA